MEFSSTRCAGGQQRRIALKEGEENFKEREAVSGHQPTGQYHFPVAETIFPRIPVAQEPWRERELLLPSIPLMSFPQVSGC